MLPPDTCLDAAGIYDPDLRASFRACRSLHARHGRTYYLATNLLPPARRPWVWALYGFARATDEIVDDLAVADSPAQRRARLEAWTATRVAELQAGRSTHPVGRAMVHTVRTWDIPLEHVTAFLDAMATDLTVHQYDTFDDLLGYMHGSAAVIGLQMLPILGTQHPDAGNAAQALGIAFQLTNFIRDVGEDLVRGRLYLPGEDLARFAVTRTDLERGEVTPRVRELIRFQIARARSWYDLARPGIAMLHPSSRECIGAAHGLYAGILDAVERSDYQVLRARATVGTVTRVRVGLSAYRRARRSWPAPDTLRLPKVSQHSNVHSTSAKPNSRSSTGA
ncbi:MAG TPA: phytoene/squalene synthase family protein [Sporichthyaceae bacterium]|jgi:phytoene synthase|nr:phytoene/squalene synthase family protein [Sporichthyaceae bacterium]